MGGAEYVDEENIILFDFRIILFSVMIVVTLKEFRDYYRQGILFFWQGMVMSLLFTVIFSLIASSLLWAFGHWKPEFVTQFVTLYKEQVRASPPPQIIDQIGKKAFEQNLKALDATTAGDVAWLYAKQSFMISFFVSIIISVILRRQPNPK